jgi:hypothetical protein
MFILDNEQPAEQTSLSRLLRNWWARLLARLGQRPSSESQPDRNRKSQDRSGGLIL